jgi:hypothetical protein
MYREILIKLSTPMGFAAGWLASISRFAQIESGGADFHPVPLKLDLGRNHLKHALCLSCREYEALDDQGNAVFARHCALQFEFTRIIELIGLALQDVRMLFPDHLKIEKVSSIVASVQEQTFLSTGVSEIVKDFKGRW